MLGVRLGDRQSELEIIREELRKHLDHIKSLSQFLDKIQRLLPKENIPQTKDDADNLVKNIKVISLKNYYNKEVYYLEKKFVLIKIFFFFLGNIRRYV